MGVQLNWRVRGRVLAAGTALLAGLAACGGGDVTPPDDSENNGSVVSSVRVKPCACFMAPASSDRTIGVLGTKVRIMAEALAADGTVLYTSAEASARFSWSSSAREVATVDVTANPFGGFWALVTGVSEGTATITVASQGVTDEMTVTVRDRARLAWSVPLSGEYMNADVAIGADGTIYVVTFGAGGSRWFAVSAQGVVLWSLDLPASFSTPAIGADGTLYGGLVDGGLIAVSPAGIVRWALGDLGGIDSSPAIGPDGTIYAAGAQHVYAVTPGGEIRWTFETTDRVFAHSSPALASDGTIYVGGTDGRLYAIRPDGSLRWTFDTGEDNIVYSGPSIARDGTIYFGSLNGLFAVGPDGAGGGLVLGRRIHKTPSIGRDGAIYVGAGWGSGGYGVVAIDDGGSVRWSSRPSTYDTPILGADGTVYVTATGPSGEQVVSALDSQGSLLWDYETPGNFWVAPAIGVDGKIFAVSLNPTVLYAIVENASTNGGFAGSPWPTARGNRANNGRAGG
jgi:outer membrane protein assembly factor BamB